jgi:adenosylcobinamide kinase/adenosylcobinamide-phosphate guanylyltransferase
MRERVLRHRAARGNKGFETWEQDADVSKVLPRLDPAATLLLECLGTLLANEMFGRTDDEKEVAFTDKKKEKIVEKIYGEILSLKANAANLLVVSNDVFMDGAAYDDDTENYRRALGALHVKLARDSHLAVECAYGRAALHKQPASGSDIPANAGGKMRERFPVFYSIWIPASSKVFKTSSRGM